MLSPRGTHTLQCRPSGRQWKAASPASWRSMLALIIRMPKPGASVDRGDIGLDGVRAGQAHDRLHERQGVARAVVDLARQQRLALFSLLAVGDVDGHAADTHDVVSGVDARHRRSDTPAQLAVRT